MKHLEKIQFAEKVLDMLESNEEWSSDVLEDISELSCNLGLSESDEHGCFKIVEEKFLTTKNMITVTIKLINTMISKAEQVIKENKELLDFWKSEQESVDIFEKNIKDLNRNISDYKELKEKVKKILDS